jgi:hypothetical protein
MNNLALSSLVPKVAIVALMLTGCVGAVPGGGGEFQNTAGGSATETGGAGTMGGQANVGGETSAGTDLIACESEALCDIDEQLNAQTPCPVGYTCRTVTASCGTVLCAHWVEEDNCKDLPVCYAGTQITGPCPSGGSCYEQTRCGTTITCLSCNPSAEYNREYLYTNYIGCTEWFADSMTCGPNTVKFTTSCGCGCEQSASCPQWVDCMPGSEPLDPLCSNDDCPYTVRAM